MLPRCAPSRNGRGRGLARATSGCLWLLFHEAHEIPCRRTLGTFSSLDQSSCTPCGDGGWRGGSDNLRACPEVSTFAEPRLCGGSVRDQYRWPAGVVALSRPGSVRPIERQASAEEKEHRSIGPDVPKKCPRLRPRKHQCDPVPVESHVVQPRPRLGSVRRVTPDHPVPRQHQPVVFGGVLLGRARPGLRDAGAWIQIERSEAVDQPLRCDPVVSGSAPPRVAERGDGSGEWGGGEHWRLVREEPGKKRKRDGFAGGESSLRLSQFTGRGGGVKRNSVGRARSHHKKALVLSLRRERGGWSPSDISERRKTEKKLGTRLDSNYRSGNDDQHRSLCQPGRPVPPLPPRRFPTEDRTGDHCRKIQPPG